MSGVDGILGLDLPQAAQTAVKAPGSGLAGKKVSAESAAKDFEAVLVDKLVQELRKTIPEDGLLEDGMSRQMQDVFWSQLAQDLGRKGGLGLWQQISRSIQHDGSVAPTPAVEHKT